MVTSTTRGANRIVFWFLSTVTVVVLLFGYHTSTSGPDVSAPLSAQVAPASTDQGGATTDPGGSTADPGGSAAPGGSAPDAPGSDTSSAGTSTVTGDSEDTRWGPVQVELTISDGKISDVAVPVYPDNNGRDAEINSYALPQLVKETIDAQSADIDMVSGATVTSDGYVRSLQSALDKAGR